MSSPKRSLFASVKDKLSGRSRSRSRSTSPSPNPTFGSESSEGSPWGIPAPPPAPASAPAKPAFNDPPPPPYSACAPSVAGPSSSAPLPPTITVNPAPAPARAPSPAPSFSSARSNPSITSPEDPYAFLSSFDTIFLIDDSASMAGESWRETQEALRAIAPICTAHDANGIDVYFLNARNYAARPDSPGGFTNIRTAAQVESLFRSVRPRGCTPTGTRINHILKPYLREYEAAIARTGNPDDCGVKPVNMIVITDGAPTDDPEAVIISVARRLDRLDAPPHQIGIQFFQVGRDRGAAEALRELDDSLAERGGGVRDMVDTVTWDGKDGSRNSLSADAILKVVLGAVVKRLDRRRVSLDAPPSRNRLAP